MFKGTLLPAIIEKISTLKDGSVSLTIYTQELSPQKAAELFGLRGKLATVYLSPSEVTQKELGLVDSIDPELPQKTPGQRMRNVFYLLWKQDPEGYNDFKQYYESKMEVIIDNLKMNINN